MSQAPVILIDPQERRADVIWEGAAIEAPSPVHRPSASTRRLATAFDTPAFRAAMAPAMESIRRSLLPQVNEFMQQQLGRSFQGFGRQNLLQRFWTQESGTALTSLLSPETREGFRRLAQRVRAQIPENVADLRSHEWLLLMEIGAEQRLGVAWIPRAATIRMLLDADNPSSREDVIVAESDSILSDCFDSLEATTSDFLSELVGFAKEAIATYRADHTHAAQALATNVLDTAMEQHFENGVRGVLRSLKKMNRTDQQKMRLIELRLMLATAGVLPAYQDYRYDRRHPMYSRNGSAHAVNTALYVPANAIRAITLATSVLRWMHETHDANGQEGEQDPFDDPVDK